MIEVIDDFANGTRTVRLWEFGIQVGTAVLTRVDDRRWRLGRIAAVESHHRARIAQWIQEWAEENDLRLDTVTLG